MFVCDLCLLVISTLVLLISSVLNRQFLEDSSLRMFSYAFSLVALLRPV